MKLVSDVVKGRVASWADGTVFGFDTETTGADPFTARIVSAAIVIDSAEGREVFTWLIDPGVEIELEATAVHGISTEMAREKGQDAAAAISEIVERFDYIHQKYGSIPLIMVNAAFDLTILDREIKRHHLGQGLSLAFPVIDTLICDRTLDKYRRGRRTLTATAAAYGIAIKGAHTPDGDVICAIRLARAIASRHPEFAATNLDELQVMQRKASLEWAAHFQEYRRRDNEPEFTVNGEWPIRLDTHDSDVTNTSSDRRPTRRQTVHANVRRV